MAVNTDNKCMLCLRTRCSDKCSDKKDQDMQVERMQLLPPRSPAWASSQSQHLHGWLTNCSQSLTATQPHITPTPLEAPPGFLLNLLTENKRSIYSRVLNRPLQYNNISATSVILATHCIRGLIVIYVYIRFNCNSIVGQVSQFLYEHINFLLHPWRQWEQPQYSFSSIWI